MSALQDHIASQTFRSRIFDAGRVISDTNILVKSLSQGSIRAGSLKEQMKFSQSDAQKCQEQGHGVVYKRARRTEI